MTVRWRIVTFEIVTFVFVAAMIAVMAFALSLASQFVTRVDGVHRREVIAELDSRSNRYAEQIAEVLLLGQDQMPVFLKARADMEKAFVRLREVTRAEFASIEGLEQARRDLSYIEITGRMTELYRSIDQTVDRVFALQREGKQDKAIELFRRHVEQWLSKDFEGLLQEALDDEQGELKSVLEDVRAHQRSLLFGAIAISFLALLCGAGLGYGLHRSIIQPVQALAGGARALADGALSHRIEVKGSDEFAALSRTFNEMAAALEAQRAGQMSAQERLYCEVELRTRELREANDKLRDVDLRRTQFLADVSHELRTPLTILRGETDVALRGRPDVESLRSALEGVQGQATELGALLDDLLAFAHSDGEDQSLELQPVRLRALVMAATQEGELLAGAREVHIETRFADGGATLVVDQRRIRQTLVIGLDNAIKHSPPGGLVSVTTSADAGRVSIAIEDEGAGVPADDLPRVFDRFYRGRKEQAVSQGLGIGLSIARDYVARHGGEIRLENRTGGGAVLTIVLPVSGRAA